MTTLTIRATVLLNEHSMLGPEDFKEGMSPTSLTLVRDGHSLTIWQQQGYNVVGSAVLHFTPLPHDELISNKVEALRALKTKTIADAQAKATELDSQIQKLLAITHEPA